MSRDIEIRLTPKGFFCAMFLRALEGPTIETAQAKNEFIQEQWHLFEAFITKRLKERDPTAIYPALIFNGEGGEVIGATSAEDV
jgi:hypothetical protein